MTRLRTSSQTPAQAVPASAARREDIRPASRLPLLYSARMIPLHVNGERREAADSRRNLLSYLRFDLGLTGSKYGCGEGLCGACTVLVCRARHYKRRSVMSPME
ncbi:MAG: 2Fe-2S iron-sulfur cluster-binding protein [Tepidiformaceae bacterium]